MSDSRETYAYIPDSRPKKQKGRWSLSRWKGLSFDFVAVVVPCICSEQASLRFFKETNITESRSLYDLLLMVHALS